MAAEITPDEARKRLTGAPPPPQPPRHPLPAPRDRSGWLRVRSGRPRGEDPVDGGEEVLEHAAGRLGEQRERHAQLRRAQQAPPPPRGRAQDRGPRAHVAARASRMARARGGGPAAARAGGGGARARSERPVGAHHAGRPRRGPGTTREHAAPLSRLHLAYISPMSRLYLPRCDQRARRCRRRSARSRACCSTRRVWRTRTARRFGVG